MRKTQQIELQSGSRTLVVSTTQYDSLEAFDLLTSLLDVFAPALGTILPSLARAGNVNGLGEIDGTELSAALVASIGKIRNRAERDALIFRIFAGTEVIHGEGDAKRKDMPTTKDAVGRIFGADIGAMFAAMGFALKVQFGDFWDAVRAGIERRVKTASAAITTASPSS